MIDETQVQRLVKDAKRGNRHAFGELYDLHASKLFNFIFSRIRNKATAEDLLQTVFLKAWNSLSKYKTTPNARFSTWLYQIANYTVIDYWRTKKETIELDKLDNLSQFAIEPKLYENYDFLWNAMADLPDDHRTIIYLRFIQDLSIEETAYIMNKTQVGVRVTQHRALKALRKILVKNGHEII